MKNFLKDNFVLVLGVSLPLLLIAVLLLVHGLSRMTATRPAYPVVYAAYDDYYGQHYFDFDVDADGRLRIDFKLPERDTGTLRGQQSGATLALYDPRSETLRTFDLSVPDDPPAGERIAIDVPEGLTGLTLSDRSTAPDGYRLELSSYRRSGLLREILGTGGGSRHHRLLRDGVSFRVPGVGSTPYAYQTGFVGWVVDDRG